MCTLCRHFGYTTMQQTFAPKPCLTQYFKAKAYSHVNHFIPSIVIPHELKQSFLAVIRDFENKRLQFLKELRLSLCLAHAKNIECLREYLLK